MKAKRTGDTVVLTMNLEEAKLVENVFLDMSEIAHDNWFCEGDDDQREKEKALNKAYMVIREAING